MKGDQICILLLMLCFVNSEVVPLDKSIVTEIFQQSIIFFIKISLTLFMYMETHTTSIFNQPSTGIVLETIVFVPY